MLDHAVPMPGCGYRGAGLFATSPRRRRIGDAAGIEAQRSPRVRWRDAICLAAVFSAPIRRASVLICLDAPVPNRLGALRGAGVRRGACGGHAGRPGPGRHVRRGLLAYAHRLAYRPRARSIACCGPCWSRLSPAMGRCAWTMQASAPMRPTDEEHAVFERLEAVKSAAGSGRLAALAVGPARATSAAVAVFAASHTGGAVSLSSCNGLLLDHTPSPLRHTPPLPPFFTKKWRKPTGDEGARREASQLPVLTERIEQIGRCADGEAAEDVVLPAPRMTAGRDPYRRRDRRSAPIRMPAARARCCAIRSDRSATHCRKQ